MKIIKLDISLISLLLDFYIKNKKYSNFFYPHDFSYAKIEEIIKKIKKDYYGVIIFKNKIIGYGILRGWDDNYEIPSLGIMIDKDYHKMGIASMFMKYLHIVAKLNNSKKVRLTVFKDNLIAIKLYEKEGYIFSEYNKDKLIGIKIL